MKTVNLKEDFKMKKKTFNKIASISALGAMLVPTAMSAVNADTVAKTAKTSSSVVETSSINSVAQVRDAMSKEGLNLSHVQGKYIVRKGDTLLAISQAANESMAEIAKVNHITNLNLIYVGQVLYLGSNGVVKAQSASANNEVANNAGTGVAANVMSNGGNTTGSSIATPANNGIYRGFTGNGTVAAHPARTAEQARNAAKVGLSTNTSANSHADAKTSAKHEAPAKADTSTKAPAKTTSAVKSSAKASSAKTDTSKVSSSASSVKSSVASSTASSAKHSSAVSSSTPAKASSATSSSVASSTTSKPAASTSTSSASSSKAPVASSTASSQAQSSQTSKPAASTTSSSTASSQTSSTASSVDYDKGVVNSDGTVNYQAAINQKGPWQGKSATPNAQGQSPAEQEWLKDHPGAQMNGSQYADGSQNEVPAYANNGTNGHPVVDRPAMTQQQLQDANTQMQKNINAPETFGNGIQWVSSDYKGEVTGTVTPVNATNPEQTPYEPYANTVGRVDANIVKQDYGKQPVAATNMSNGDMKAPQGSHYVSSNITNSDSSDGVHTNQVTLTFYK